MQQYWEEQLGFFSPELRAISPPTKLDEAPCEKLALQSVHSTYESKNERKRLAGQRSREKKKNYIATLEEEVRRLSTQLEDYDTELSKCKDRLVDALKASHVSTNEHAYTFTQMERIIKEEDPDLDRLNLLIDLLKNRIGAGGSERQANLAYTFKQIVNAMFPAIYRYIFNTAEQSLDLFSDSPEGESTWTSELYSQIKVDDWQREQLKALRGELFRRKQEAVEHTRRLRQAKEKIKRQGEEFDARLGDLREDMNPVQCALVTLFAEKNKLRREFAFSGDFEQPATRKQLKLE